MSSEIPPISKSEDTNDNTNFEPVESQQVKSQQADPENQIEKATPENFSENWSKDVQDAVSNSESAVEKTDLPESPELTELSEVLELLEPIESEIYSEPKNVEAKKVKSEPELFVDSWLDEPKSVAPTKGDSDLNSQPGTAENHEITTLERQKDQLQQEVVALQKQKEQILQDQAKVVQESMGRMIDEGTKELRERKIGLQVEIEKLERRQERISQEMRRNFAGSSQELAVRVQGFKNYLVGSLQDLVSAADKLELIRPDTSTPRNRERVRGTPRRDGQRRDEFEALGQARGERARGEGERGKRRYRDDIDRSRSRNEPGQAVPAQFSESSFADQSRRIRQLLDQYRNSPDYYGSPWQLRRTFDSTHAKKVQDWFFSQGGRGTLDSMGSRLQNILVASAAVSILHNLYGDRCRVLVLTDTPENLGEWRRGLQDCLGISRSDFGSNRGVVLFDTPEVLVQRAERLIQEKLLPVIIVDETEELLNLSVLKFPVWLAFASGNKSTSSNYLY